MTWLFLGQFYEDIWSYAEVVNKLTHQDKLHSSQNLVFNLDQAFIDTNKTFIGLFFKADVPRTLGVLKSLLT